MNPSELDIIYEDEAIAVVDKPSGVIVHPAPGHETGALTDALVRRFPGMARVGSAERPGVVHRLDIETSGVMVFAKTQGAYLDLRRQFESHRTVGKTYLAVVHGSPRPKSGTIDEPVGRERQSAVTHWETLGRHDGISLVEFKIDTGRMHQIRIHAASRFPWLPHCRRPALRQRGEGPADEAKALAPAAARSGAVVPPPGHAQARHIRRAPAGRHRLRLTARASGQTAATPAGLTSRPWACA